MDVLFIVANDASIGTGDQAVIDHHENTRGDTVTVGSDEDAAVASGTHDLIVISESVSSGTVPTAYLRYADPVLHMEAYALDDGTTPWISGGANLAPYLNYLNYVDDSVIDIPAFTVGDQVDILDNSGQVMRITGTWGAGFSDLFDWSTTASSGVTIAVCDTGGALH